MREQECKTEEANRVLETNKHIVLIDTNSLKNCILQKYSSRIYELNSIKNI